MAALGDKNEILDYECDDITFEVNRDEFADLDCDLVGEAGVVDGGAHGSGCFYCDDRSLDWSDRDAYAKHLAQRHNISKNVNFITGVTIDKQSTELIETEAVSPEPFANSQDDLEQSVKAELSDIDSEDELSAESSSDVAQNASKDHASEENNASTESKANLKANRGTAAKDTKQNLRENDDNEAPCDNIKTSNRTTEPISVKEEASAVNPSASKQTPKSVCDLDDATEIISPDDSEEECDLRSVIPNKKKYADAQEKKDGKKSESHRNPPQQVVRGGNPLRRRRKRIRRTKQDFKSYRETVNPARVRTLPSDVYNDPFLMDSKSISKSADVHSRLGSTGLRSQKRRTLPPDAYNNPEALQRSRRRSPSYEERLYDRQSEENSLPLPRSDSSTSQLQDLYSLSESERRFSKTGSGFEDLFNNRLGGFPSRGTLDVGNHPNFGPGGEENIHSYMERSNFEHLSNRTKGPSSTFSDINDKCFDRASSSVMGSRVSPSNAASTDPSWYSDIWSTGNPDQQAGFGFDRSHAFSDNRATANNSPFISTPSNASSNVSSWHSDSRPTGNLAQQAGFGFGRNNFFSDNRATANNSLYSMPIDSVTSHGAEIAGAGLMPLKHFIIYKVDDLHIPGVSKPACELVATFVTGTYAKAGYDSAKLESLLSTGGEELLYSISKGLISKQDWSLHLPISLTPEKLAEMITEFYRTRCRASNL